MMHMAGRDLAVEIVSGFVERGIPVDVEGLARELGIQVTTATLPDDVSGKIECELDRACTMIVNAGHSVTRRRFTIAHEIAHFVLHRDLIGDGVIDDGLYRSATLSGTVERQANRYAASILMPQQFVRAFWSRGIRSPQELATAFGVSPAVAEIRIAELGLSP